MKHYTEFSKLPSYIFTMENSIRGNHEKIIDYYDSLCGLTDWEIAGYTLNPPFETHYKSVAIMFEDKITFEKRWCHYPIDYFKVDEIAPHKIEIKLR